MIKLCCDLGLPHSGCKAYSQTRIQRSTSPQPITTSDTTITLTTMAQASTISLQPTLSPTLTHATIASTSNVNNTALQPSDQSCASQTHPACYSGLFWCCLAPQGLFTGPASSLYWNHAPTCTSLPSSTW